MLKGCEYKDVESRFYPFLSALICGISSLRRFQVRGVVKKTMKTISIRQPWAWAILHAGKDVENRNWKTTLRGHVLIHASKTFDMDRWKWIAENATRLGFLEIPYHTDFLTGGIVGRTDIVDCVTESESKWFCGPYGFVLENTRELPYTPYKGMPGLFNIDTKHTTILGISHETDINRLHGVVEGSLGGKTFALCHEIAGIIELGKFRKIVCTATYLDELLNLLPMLEQVLEEHELPKLIRKTQARHRCGDIYIDFILEKDLERYLIGQADVYHCQMEDVPFFFAPSASLR